MSAIEGPRGETGCYIASPTGRPDAVPHAHARPERSPTSSVFPHMMRGGLVADAVAVISSVDPVLDGVDR